jgi:hypothetical protein
MRGLIEREFFFEPRPHALTVAFVGSPLLPAFRGICGRALRLVVFTHVFASSNPDGFGFLINDNVLKSELRPLTDGVNGPL